MLPVNKAAIEFRSFVKFVAQTLFLRSMSSFIFYFVYYFDNNNNK